MEAQYKSATRKAQQLTKDTPQEEINQMLANMTALKEQLCQVSEDVAGQLALSPPERMIVSFISKKPFCVLNFFIPS